MKHWGILVSFWILTQISTSALASVVVENGALGVSQSHVVNSQGDMVQLTGVSFFWSNLDWQGAKYYQPDVVDYFVDNWEVTVLRFAIAGQGPGSWIDRPSEQWQLLTQAVDRAIERGVYVVVDFHSHRAHLDVAAAESFFQNVASHYGDIPNVIYEIYNEPLADASWSRELKPYAERIIPIIRRYAPNSLIIMGTPSWSQDVDVASLDPLEFNNVAYSLHFYAATHRQELRDKAEEALNRGVALFVSEWGSVQANGDGDIDYESVEAWFDFIDENSLSHIAWSVSDKDESSAIFTPSPELRDFELTENGELVRSLMPTSDGGLK